MNYGVILAGGRGQRFWPLSRINRPKQFLKLTSDKVMLEETVDRVRPLIPIENFRVVTGESMRPLIATYCTALEDYHVLAEPVGRNTCAAIGLAAVHLIHDDPDAVMVVLSADHLISPAEKLLKIIENGLEVAASEDYLITIGIVPTRPETAYGYIKVGDNYRVDKDIMIHHVSAFTEKPKAAVAHEYYYSHKFLWNSGMFIWSAASILKAIAECRTDIAELLEEYRVQIGTAGEAAARVELYDKVDTVSIDIAVLERASNVLTIKADIIWDDIGGWNALARYKKTGADNNVISGEVMTIDTYESIIVNNGDGIVACLGVADLVVVRSDDIILVAHRTKVDQVKELLESMEQDESKRKYL